MLKIYFSPVRRVLTVTGRDLRGVQVNRKREKVPKPKKPETKEE